MKTRFFISLVLTGALSGLTQELRSAGSLLVDVSADTITAANGAAVTTWLNGGTFDDFHARSGNSGATFTNSILGKKAVVFDGTAQSVLLSGTAPSSITGRNPWSVETWVWVPAVPPAKSVYLSWTQDTGVNSWDRSLLMLRYDAGNVAVDQYGVVSSFGYGIPAFGAWHHIVATRATSGIQHTYVDGNISRRFTIESALEGGRPLAIGGVLKYNTSEYTSFFAGALSRLRIHTGTLSEADVRNNYLADAQSYNAANIATWTGGSANWNEAANWSNGVVGVSGKAVRILSGSVGITNRVSEGYSTEFDLVKGSVGLTASSARLDTKTPFAIGRDAGNSATLNIEKGSIFVSSDKGAAHVDLGLSGADSMLSLGGAGSYASLHAWSLRAFDGPSDIQLKSNALLELDGVQSGTLTNISMSVSGGTLRNRAGSTMGYLHNVPQVKVSTGGVTFDTISGSKMAVAACLLHDESGPAAGGGLRKIGAGRLILSSTNTYAGATVIEAGTLELAPRLLDGLVYRLDAHTNALSTLVLGNNSNVISWADANGSGILFTTNKTEIAPVYDAALFGGRGGLRFTRNSTICRLATKSVTRAQSVFAVISPASGNDLGGLWGASENDYGIRLTSGTVQYAGNDGDFSSTGWVYMNGVNKNTFTVGQPVVVTAIAGNSQSRATAIGDYWANTTHRRVFKGDIAEILVYDRRLDDREHQEVEAYLMAKWLGTVPAPQFSASLLPENTALNVYGGASVELGGTSLKLASLNGAGSIGNKALALSSLTVGSLDADSIFAGHIAGNARLVKIGGGTVVLAGLNSYTGSTAIEAGTLSIIGGTTSVTGLVYRLDASQTDTFSTLADGSNVTSWVDANGSGFTFTAASDVNCPVYDSSLFNGRGGLRFGVGSTRSRMVGSATANAQTLIAVNMIRDTRNNNGGLWGKNLQDSGLRIGETTWYYPGNDNDFHYAGSGGLVYMNGGVSNSIASVGVPHVLTSVSGSRQSFKPAIGDYWFSSQYTERAYHGDVAEILVYDRKLTDLERRSVELTLMAKWFPTGDGETVLPKSADISVAQGATLDLSGGSVTIGSLTGGGLVSNGVLSVTGNVAPNGTLTFTETPVLTGTLAIDVAAEGSNNTIGANAAIDISGLELLLNLPEGKPAVGAYTLISASGGVTGVFESESVSGAWSIVYDANAVRLLYASGTVFIIR
ncbi:MAG: autotransporter-associated beta strand repeat-containing protein [Kiritimatiellae bacterium]|nr:autotransporter-associated beta strand repeat-containing protein [Kiritimatiellia bacterium]